MASSRAAAAPRGLAARGAQLAPRRACLMWVVARARQARLPETASCTLHALGVRPTGCAGALGAHSARPCTSAIMAARSSAPVASFKLCAIIQIESSRNVMTAHPDRCTRGCNRHGVVSNMTDVAPDTNKAPPEAARRCRSLLIGENGFSAHQGCLKWGWQGPPGGALGVESAGLWHLLT